MLPNPAFCNTYKSVPNKANIRLCYTIS